MSQLSPSELTKVRKSALHSVTLSTEMKTTVVDAKLKEFTAEVKKVLTKKNFVLEMLVVQR
jgi:hypothetical protein